MSARSFKPENLEKLAIKVKFQSAQMAAIRRISPKQQQRDFKEAFNKTPTEWLREFRCRLVVQLLAKGYTNKAAASELHYASETHMCHDFRKVFAESPQKVARSAFEP